VSRPRNAVPPLRFHSTSGQWYYFTAGRRHLLGKDKAVAEHRHRAAMLARATRDEASATPDVAPSGITIAEGAALFLRSEGDRWRQQEFHRNSLALTSLYDLFPGLPAEALRFADLERWTKEMLRRPSMQDPKKTLSRQYVAKLLGSIRHCWRWLALRDRVSAEAAARVTLAVRECKRIGGRESPPRTAVPEESVAATLAKLRSDIADMLRVQLATGMRTGELLAMHADEILIGARWVYAPKKHKNAWRGKPKYILLPEAIHEILRPRMRRGKLWEIGPSGYWIALRKACKAAGVEPWQPYQLRHAAATEARIMYGDDAAVRMLGHVGKSLLDRYTRSAGEIERRRAG